MMETTYKSKKHEKQRAYKKLKINKTKLQTTTRQFSDKLSKNIIQCAYDIVIKKEHKTLTKKLNVVPIVSSSKGGTLQQTSTLLKIRNDEKNNISQN